VHFFTTLSSRVPERLSLKTQPTNVLLGRINKGTARFQINDKVAGYEGVLFWRSGKKGTEKENFRV